MLIECLLFVEFSVTNIAVNPFGFCFFIFFRARWENRVNEFQCDECEYKSGSKTLLHRHMQSTHARRNNSEEIIETTASLKIRKRFSCDICHFKATNENNLKIHLENIHQNEKYEKTRSKRIHCNMCDRKFNKQETFNNHMKISHQNNNNKTVNQEIIGRSQELEEIKQSRI